jgi:hypothetical protein
MKVGGDVSFNDTVFEGPVSFILADIAGNFSGHGVMFQNKETGANFSSLKVRGYAFFLSGAVFEGLADFGSVNIASIFAAGGKVSEQGKASQLRRHEGRWLRLFQRCGVRRPVNFALAEIATALSANQAKFQNKETEANFGSMKVGGRALFNDVVFEGPVNFVLAEIAGAFNVNEAKFHNKEGKPTSTA